MIKENKIKKIKYISILLVSFIIISSFIVTIFADSISDYQRELEEVKRQEKENAQKLSGIEQELAQYMYEIAELDSKIVEYSNQLANIQVKVSDVNTKLAGYEKDLQNAAQGYNKAEDLYISRLRAIYENGIPTIWDILFTSKGISDFFAKMNVYTSILEYDKSLIGNMQSQKDYVDFIKKDIESKKLQLEQFKYDTEKSNDALNNTLEQKQKNAESLKNSQSALKANSELLIKRREDAIKKVEDEVARIIAESNQNGDSTNFPGGNFAWPVPGFTVITTRFNEIYNLVNPSGSAHTGTDVAGSGINRSPIVAIESGTVTTATYSNYGYGNYVMINHGKSVVDNKNYISLYGHCSSLVVSKGQQVTKGQLIGYVGSTGNSTGPHLHLEVRINGKITDPLVQYPNIKFKFV